MGIVIMEQIYNYIVHNKIDGSIILPFKYHISGDTVHISMLDYHSYWVKLMSILKADYNIHKVTGCLALNLYSKYKDIEEHFVWNGHSYDIFDITCLKKI